MNSKILLLFLLFSLQYFSFSISFTQEEYLSNFETWAKTNNKTYSKSEFIYRFRVFQQNMNYVYEHNSKNYSFTLGLNKFADLTNSEFIEKYIGFNNKEQTQNREQDPDHLYRYDSTLEIPVSLDWRKKGLVTSIKDQGICACSWAFSTTGSVEGAWAFNYTQVSLSEQNLLDCSRLNGNFGCTSGSVLSSYKYIIQNQGIDTESSYPYEVSTSYNCRYSIRNRGATISNYGEITQGSESALQNALVYRGPISAKIDSNNLSFQLYNGGYYYEPKCSSTDLSHSVLVIGYDSSSSGEYWIVKNSWGTSWGESGYINMAKNQNNNCGIATQSYFPII